jgi:hypothetical protein
MDKKCPIWFGIGFACENRSSGRLFFWRSLAVEPVLLFGQRPPGRFHTLIALKRGLVTGNILDEAMRGQFWTPIPQLRGSILQAE